MKVMKDSPGYYQKVYESGCSDMNKLRSEVNLRGLKPLPPAAIPLTANVPVPRPVARQIDRPASRPEGFLYIPRWFTGQAHETRGWRARMADGPRHDDSAWSDAYDRGWEDADIAVYHEEQGDGLGAWRDHSWRQ